MYCCVPVTFDDIYEIISCSARFPYCDIHVIDFILAEYCFNLFLIHVRQRDCIRDCNTAFFLPTHQNGWRPLVETDTETFEFRFDKLLISQRLENIKYDKDEVTCSGD